MTASYTGMNPEGTGALTDHDQLWQSVTKILTTPTGSRVMRRDFGSAIPDLLDAPQNAVTRLASAMGISTEGLVKDEEELAQERQAAQQQAQGQMMMEKLGPEALRQIGGMAQAGNAEALQGMQQGLQQQMQQQP